MCVVYGVVMFDYVWCLCLYFVIGGYDVVEEMLCVYCVCGCYVGVNV